MSQVSSLPTLGRFATQIADTPVNVYFFCELATNKVDPLLDIETQDDARTIHLDHDGQNDLLLRIKQAISTNGQCNEGESLRFLPNSNKGKQQVQP